MLRHLLSTLIIASSCALLMPASAAEAGKDSRCYEMRVYYSPAGKLDDLHAISITFSHGFSPY